MRRHGGRIERAGLKIADEIIASLMLAGLPDDYRSMVMAIENSTEKLTSDMVKTRLLQEPEFNRSSNGASALVAKKTQWKKKSVKCFECDEIGHMRRNCPKNKKKAENLLLASSSFVAKENSKEWFIDSGASAHMTMCDNSLIDLREPKSKEIVVGDNARLNVKCAGDMRMAIPNNCSSIGDTSNETKVTLTDVLCIPDICANLMSVSQMTKHGKTLIFDRNNCRIFDENSNLLATAPLVNNLYTLNATTSSKNATAFVAKVNRNLWHRRLAHSCDENLRKVRASVTGVEFSEKASDQCVVCAEGKQTRATFKEPGNRASELLEIIHSDVCGPISTKSFSGARFLLTFIDDFSRKVFVYPMKTKG